MSSSFDPYHRWLGIRPEEQPADHYRLLGIARFEDDVEVIRDAAERQMGHVRRYAMGRHANDAHRILDELGRAKACLIDRGKKAAYDAMLKAAGDVPGTSTSSASANAPIPLEFASPRGQARTIARDEDAPLQLAPLPRAPTYSASPIPAQRRPKTLAEMQAQQRRQARNVPSGRQWIRQPDDLLMRIAGEDNTLLHNFLRAFVAAAVVLVPGVFVLSALWWMSAAALAPNGAVATGSLTPDAAKHLTPAPGQSPSVSNESTSAITPISEPIDAASKSSPMTNEGSGLERTSESHQPIGESHTRPDDELLNEADPNRRFIRWVLEAKGEVELLSGEKLSTPAALLNDPLRTLVVRSASLRNLTDVPSSIESIADRLKLLGLGSDEFSANVAVLLFNRSIATCEKLTFVKHVTDEQLNQLQYSEVLRCIEFKDFYSSESYTEHAIEVVERFPNATRIVFEGGPITDASLQHLAELQKIEDLTIWGDTRVTDQGLTHLSGMTTLKAIGLGGNRQIVGTGFQHLTGLPNLSTLNLYGMSLGDEAMPYLGRLSATNTLWLEETNITDTRLGELDGLEKLWGLVISGTAVTDSGIDNLTVLNRLGNFDFANSNVTDAGLRKLHAYKNLKKIDVRNTKVTSRGVQALQAALPGCRIDNDFFDIPGT